MSQRRFALSLALLAWRSLCACGSGAEPDGGDNTSGTPSSVPSAGPDGSDAAALPPVSPSVDGGALDPNDCITSVAAGQHTFECDGISYAVTLPAACVAGGCGVVLDIHGATMNAAMEDKNTRMRAIGAREGYVVVQPNAPGTPPNAIWQPPAHYPKVWAFFERVLTTFKTDPKRVHVTGFSQGGRMTFTFACGHADRIASAAPAAEAGCTTAEATAASRQVPMLYMHGKNDVIVPFNAVAVPQRDSLISAWSLGTTTPVASDAAYTRTRHSNAQGTVLELVEHTYSASSALLGGHCFPGSSDTSGGEPGQLFGFGCIGPNAFDWGEEVIAFFKAHPMP
jgi:polyhydroxybutyrate depolymerase